MTFDKKRLKREIERERKRKVNARRAELRELIKQARARRAERLSVIRDQCKAERQALTIQCANRRQQARDEARSVVTERRAELGHVDAEERVYREADATIRKRRGRTTARERKAESDDEVRENLPADLVPVFDTVRRGIKGGPRKSRTEAFLEWAQENPEDVLQVQMTDADRDVERLIREYQELSKPAKQRRLRREAVPF